jgi:hypothetical protein
MLTRKPTSWPFGTIPAGIVAGVYGSRAAELMLEMRTLKTVIDGEENTVQGDINAANAVRLGKAGSAESEITPLQHEY